MTARPFDVGQAGSLWRGYVNQVLYGVSLRTPADDEVVEQLAAALIRQQVFTSPVERYYEAVVAGLRSGERLTFHDEFQHESAVRDLLTRLVQRLDEKRPWPEHPFHALDRSEWGGQDELFDAPVIGWIPLSPWDLTAHLNRAFTGIRRDGAEIQVLVLRLRTGQVVVLRSTRGVHTPGVDLLARTDPESTLTAFRELIGITEVTAP